MLVEMQLINHWIYSKEIGFLRKLKLDASSFDKTTAPVVDYIYDFIRSYNALPNHDTLKYEFELFNHYSEDSLEPITSLVDRLKQKWAGELISPALIGCSKKIVDGSAIESLYLLKNEADKVLKTVNHSVKEYSWTKDAVERYDLYMLRHGKEGLMGMATGLDTFDKVSSGLLSDDMLLITGRTGEGKSYVASFIALNVWEDCVKAGLSSPVIYFSTEMSAISVSNRLDTMKAHFPFTCLREGKLENPEDYKEYLEGLEKKPSELLIYSEQENGGKAFTPDDIYAVVEDKKPALVVVDQLYDISDGTGERDIRRRIVNTSNAIRSINLNTKTPFILLAQSGRGAAKAAIKDSEATPELHDIQESDNPAQKATRVITLRLTNNMMKLVVKKNRDSKKGDEMFYRIDFESGVWEETEKEAQTF